MAVPWNNSALFSLAECLPCCVAAGCTCTDQFLYDPDGPGGTVYASLADAEYIRDFGVASCLAVGPTTDNPQLHFFTAGNTAATTTVACEIDNSLNPSLAPAFTAFVGAQLVNGDTFYARCAVSTNGSFASNVSVRVTLYNLDANCVYQNVGYNIAESSGFSTTNNLSFPITANGLYRAAFTAVGRFDPNSDAVVNGNALFSSSGAFTPLFVNIQYDCSAACPCSLNC